MAYVSFIEEHFRNKLSAEAKASGLVEGRASGVAEGRASGLAEGRRTEKLATATRLRAFGMPDQDILKITELSIADLNSL